MDISEIMQKPFDKALDALTEVSKGKDDEIDANRKAYDGKHEILEDSQRAPKTVGDTAENQRVVKHTSETVPFQQRIVESAVTFLFGNPLKLSLTEGDEDAFALINDVWKKNKLDYFNKELARNLFIECKVAELWHIPPYNLNTEKARIRVTLLCKKIGYQIYPHYDAYGDMDAFTVQYETKDGDGKAMINATVYTAKTIYRATKQTGDWQMKPGANLCGKIPIVYLEQEKPEWDCVKTQINRYEYLISNHADTNDYNGSPLTQVKGEVSNMPKKEETGKVVVVQKETNIAGDVTYPGGVEFVSWDQSPESIKLEMDNLKDIIYGMTQTPDLSFQNVKGMSAVSGIALRLMFSDALFKAMNKQEIFGPAIERRLSILKALIGTTDNAKAKALDELDIDIKFSDVLPQDIQALITALSTARGGEPIMSMESAVRQNILVQDAEKDIAALEAETSTLKSFAESYQ